MRLIRKLGGQLREYTVCRWSLLSKLSPSLRRVYDFSNVSWFSQLVSIHRGHHDRPQRRRRRYLTIAGTVILRVVASSDDV